MRSSSRSAEKRAAARSSWCKQRSQVRCSINGRDLLLSEQLEKMAEGTAGPLYAALVFCFNRDECWNVAELLKGSRCWPTGSRRLAEALALYDFSDGAGPKLKQILQRGVGVHHAGVLPKYRRVVEELFQQKLLSVCVCTETLAAGINLPARSVVLPTLLKGKPGEMKVIDASTAHQIFGRAGRPQFDTQGYVFALAHEDDVKILRAKEKLDQIPEDTKDPNLLRKRKELKNPDSTEQYWTEQQWDKLRTAPPLKLTSRGQLPWRLLAYMLDVSPEVELIRKLVGKRLMDSGHLVGAQKQLDRMLLTLWAAGYVKLEPAPPAEQPDRETERQRDGETEGLALFSQSLRPPSPSSPPSSKSSHPRFALNLPPPAPAPPPPTRPASPTRPRTCRSC
jgi:hypothetical protein